MKTTSCFTVVGLLMLTLAGTSHAAAPCPASNTVATVTNCTEADLRVAVSQAATVVFACDGTITLASPIEVTCSLTLDASGHSVVLSGGNSNRIFEVQSNASLSLIHLTIANGLKRGTNGISSTLPALYHGGSVAGGALTINFGTLRAIDCLFASNAVFGGAGGRNTWFSSSDRPVGGGASGGAIYANSSSIILSNCTFNANYGSGGVGGVLDSLPFQVGASGNAFGAAIYALGGGLLVANCSFTNNLAAGRGGGGAVWCQSTNSHVTASRFLSNRAQAGGAIFDECSRSYLSNCSFTANAALGAAYERYGGLLAPAYGGAYYHGVGAAEIVACAFTSNASVGAVAGQGAAGVYHASSGFGGAVAHRGGSLSLSQSLVASNLAQGGETPLFFIAGTVGHGVGGAVYVATNAMITNCTMAFNRALAGAMAANYPVGARGIGIGGAMAVESGTVAVGFCTIVANTAQSEKTNGTALGGGLSRSGGTVTIGNSILSQNKTNAAFENANGVMTDLGHNLSSDATPVWTLGTSLNNTDPLLGPLSNNGGPTLTMALGAGSPALDTADCATAPATDQRGYPRPSGPGCDIGAYEGPPATQMFIARWNNATNVLRWAAESGRVYLVEESMNLSTWTPFATNAAPASGWLELPVPANPSPRFFRLLIQ